VLPNCTVDSYRQGERRAPQWSRRYVSSSR
jgi:hypothetical protein